jgi:hypothetical protein
VSSDEAGMPGSHAANQSKTEPMPPTTGHGDPDAAPEPVTVEAPELDSMSVSVNDAQSPSHEAAGGHGDRGHSGVPALDTPVLSGDTPANQRPTAHTGDSTGRADGPIRPVDDESGTAHRAPGSLGTTGPDEQIETDMERSAGNTNVTGTPGTRAGSGDPQSVPVPGEVAAPGTSQESAVAQGSRTPE